MKRLARSYRFVSVSLLAAVLIPVLPRPQGLVGQQEDSSVTAAGRATQSLLQVPRDTIPVPEDVLDPPWLESRREAQLRVRSRFDVFHDFGFSDSRVESGIQFRHRIVDDVAKTFKPVHYDHGNGIAVADVDGDGRYDIYFVSQAGQNELWRNRGDGRFEDITGRAGVAVADRISVTASFADIDNDGDPDLYVTTVRQGNLLFENDGSGRFTDISTASGLDHTGHSSGAVFFDYDRDGLLDLFLTNVGRYTSDTLRIGTVDGVDYSFYDGLMDAFGGHLEPDRTEENILFRNLGQRRFEDVSDEVGLRDGSWSGDASPIDTNDDGWPDLYVLNMQGHDQYYENIEGERFLRRSRELFPRTPWGSMGIAVLDYNNDGRTDIFITDMHSDMSEAVDVGREKRKSNMQWPESFLRSGGKSIFGNAFYERKGSGSYGEVSDQIGVENYWPWGCSAGDLNADGWEDLFVASSMSYPYRYGVNSVLINNRGERFLDSEFILGVEPRRGPTARPWFELDCSEADRDHKLCRGRDGQFVVLGAVGSRSSVIFDLDDDGDLDIVTNDFNSPPMVLLSDLSSRKTPLRFLKVRLVGTQSNRSGLGAMVRVRTESRTYTKVLDGKSGYLSQSLLPLYFGLDSAERIEEIRVRWPSGRRQTVAPPIEFNSLVTVVEG